MKMKAFVILMLILCTLIFSQEEQKKKIKKSLFRLTQRDIILPLTSIEWGEPDRWSFTSRYIHMFGDTENKEIWKNQLGLSVSPGWSGIRSGIDYMGIYSPKNMSGEFAIFSQFRALILRTWGNPLTAEANETYAGAEVKFCLSFIFCIGGGYYYPISDPDDEPFYGFHIGVGI